MESSTTILSWPIFNKRNGGSIVLILLYKRVSFLHISTLSAAINDWKSTKARLDKFGKVVAARILLVSLFFLSISLLSDIFVARSNFFLAKSTSSSRFVVFKVYERFRFSSCHIVVIRNENNRSQQINFIFFWLTMEKNFFFFRLNER